MKHVVYTRCTYDTNEEVARRLILSKRFTIPAVAAQEHSHPVRWVWLCKPKHEDMIHEAVRMAGYAGELCFNLRDRDDDIQSTLDSDDWIAPTYFQDIQTRYFNNIAGHNFRNPEQSLLIYYHPWRYQISTGKWFKPARIANWTSMFYSIFNPSDSIRIYYRRHTQIRTVKNLVRVQAIPSEGLVCLVIHDHNKCTTIKKGDIEIPAPSTFVDKYTTR